MKTDEEIELADITVIPKKATDEETEIAGITAIPKKTTYEEARIDDIIVLPMKNGHEKKFLLYEWRQFQTYIKLERNVVIYYHCFTKPSSL